jgi:hypothetical protein
MCPFSTSEKQCCPIYSFKWNYKECVSDKKNRCRRRRLADAWRLDPGRMGPGITKICIYSPPHWCKRPILWMFEKNLALDLKYRQFWFALRAGPPTRCIIIFINWGHSRAQESARDAAGVGRSWPVRAHSAPLKPVLPTGRKLGRITQKGQKKCEDGIKLQPKFMRVFLWRSKSGPIFFTSFKYFAPLKSLGY